MKNKILTIFFLIAFNSINAQDFPAKRTDSIATQINPYLPESKDWSIGIDVGQLINYFDGFFKNKKVTTTIIDAQTITGKYFKDLKTAYRASISLGFNSYDSRKMTLDRTASTNSVAVFPAPVLLKENVWNRSIGLFGVSVGLEKRRGKSKMQGVYGAEVGLYISSSSDKFTYGNLLSTSIIAPVKVDTIADAMSSSLFGNANNISQNATNLIQGKVESARIKERNNGTSFTFGLRAFIGAEYFILPKMSIGSEFGFGLAFVSGARTSTQWESIGQSINSSSSNQIIGSTTIDSAYDGSIRLNSDNLNSIFGASAALRFNLYF